MVPTTPPAHSRALLQALRWALSSRRHWTVRLLTTTDAKQRWRGASGSLMSTGLSRLRWLALVSPGLNQGADCGRVECRPMKVPGSLVPVTRGQGRRRLGTRAIEGCGARSARKAEPLSNLIHRDHFGAACRIHDSEQDAPPSTKTASIRATAADWGADFLLCLASVQSRAAEDLLAF